MILKDFILMPTFFAKAVCHKHWMLSVYSGVLPKFNEYPDHGVLIANMKMELWDNDFHAQGTILVTGKIDYYRMRNNEGKVECQGKCGLHGTSMNFSSLHMYAGGNIDVDGRFE